MLYSRIKRRLSRRDLFTTTLSMYSIDILSRALKDVPQFTRMHVDDCAFDRGFY